MPNYTGNYFNNQIFDILKPDLYFMSDYSEKTGIYRVHKIDLSLVNPFAHGEDMTFDDFATKLAAEGKYILQTTEHNGVVTRVYTINAPEINPSALILEMAGRIIKESKKRGKFSPSKEHSLLEVTLSRKLPLVFAAYEAGAFPLIYQALRSETTKDTESLAEAFRMVLLLARQNLEGEVKERTHVTEDEMFFASATPYAQAYEVLKGGKIRD